MVLVVGCVMSFFGIGVDPAVKVYTAESYPTSVRATGTSVTEGIGRLFSGVIGPSLVPLLLDAGGVSAVYLLIGASAVVAVVAVAIFGEETKGRSLETITAAHGGQGEGRVRWQGRGSPWPRDAGARRG